MYNMSEVTEAVTVGCVYALPVSYDAALLSFGELIA